MAATRVALVLLVLVLNFASSAQGLDLSAGSLNSLTSFLKKASDSSRPVILVVENDANADSSSSANSVEAKPSLPLNLGKIRHQHYNNRLSRYESRSNSNDGQLKRYRPNRNANRYNREQRSYDHHSHREHHREEESYYPQSQQIYRNRDRRDRESRNSKNLKREERIRYNNERSHRLDKQRESRPFNSEKYRQERKERQHNHKYHHHHQDDRSLSSDELSREQRPLIKEERREQRRERQRQLALELKEYDQVNGGDLKYGLRTGKVIKNLLRISNDIMCEAKNDCKDECEDTKKKNKCEVKCEKKFDECEENEKEVEDDDCSNYNYEGICEGSTEDNNPSTKGAPWSEETTKCKQC